jgi:hypothetical protein
MIVLGRFIVTSGINNSMRKSFSEYVDKRNEGVTDFIRTRLTGQQTQQLPQKDLLEIGSIRDSLIELIKTASSVQNPFSQQLVKLLQQAEQYCRKPFQSKRDLF